ncbi:hypothetical protein QBC42DRAFT_248893 [Cladorrhinum samala]|uniref:IBR domain-containing protein n=1 Tax=Cladorrhinum samala TaxID=585594 RepID=A0AAV9I185_9PEZI|nr:hypothetical protein QBC42DRAFT_248893 [Cladorrhinum samala]
MANQTSSNNTADYWLALGPDAIGMMEEWPVRFRPTKKTVDCIIFQDSFTLDKLCDVHVKCGAMCCQDCLLQYLNSSINLYTSTPFPPILPCACAPEDGGQELLVPHLRCPVARFLGPLSMQEYLYHYRRLNAIKHLKHLTEEQKRQVKEEIAKSISEVAPLAEKNHWRQCPTCMQYIEFNGGCLTILCLCGERFCFECRRKLQAREDCTCDPEEGTPY